MVNIFEHIENYTELSSASIVPARVEMVDMAQSTFGYFHGGVKATGEEGGEDDIIVVSWSRPSLDDYRVKRLESNRR